MSVRKRSWTTRTGEKRTAWVVDFRDQHGKRRVETYDRRKEAVAAATKVAVAVGAGTYAAPSESLTLSEAAKVWFGKVDTNVERTTLDMYKQHVNLHILPRLGSTTRLAKLNAGIVERFANDLTKDVPPHKALSVAMARKVLTSLKSLLKANRFGHIAADVRIGTNRRQRRLEVGVDIPTPQEIKRLVEAAATLDDKEHKKSWRQRHRALVLTLALTGLRASEIRGLRWSDVDLAANTLHVRQRADRYGAIGAPKSHAGTRTIPLPPELVSALKVWRLACPKGDGLVFPTRDGHVEGHDQLQRALDRVMTAAHVVTPDGAPKYGLHSLRHFFASWAINAKASGGRELPPKVAQTLLGHSSIVMTLDAYGHLFPERSDATELAAATSALLA